MDVNREASEFLRTRRDRITPDQAGLSSWGERRRVPGLRREEVAMLAGVSVEYYVRLERGNLSGVSDGVLEAVAAALRLDDAERAHLHDLARIASSPTRRGRAVARPGVRPPVQWLLEAMGGSAAYVRNARTDILAANTLGRALYAPVFDMPGRPNVARFVFLDPRAPEFFVDWDTISREATGLLRTLAAEHPHDQGLTELIGELSTRSQAFATLWAAHHVRQHFTGTKRYRHPVVGPMTLSYESMALTADPTLRLNAYVAEPGSPSAEALSLLASWASTPTSPASSTSPTGRAAG